MVAAKVAIIQGKNISVGVAEPIDALIAIMDTGIRVSPLACRQRNIIWALLALSFLDLEIVDYPLP